MPDFVQGCTSTGSSTEFCSEVSSRVPDDYPDDARTGSSTGFARLYKLLLRIVKGIALPVNSNDNSISDILGVLVCIIRKRVKINLPVLI